jgi:uncharacterized glyoxalase superfamily protein PhnB
MAQRSWGLLVGLLLLSAVGAQAADEIPAGNYKVILLGSGQQAAFWLLKLESKDGKWTGEMIAKHERIPKATVSDVTVKDNELKISLSVQGEKYSFEGKLPPDGKKILGSLMLDQLHPAQLELTTLKSLDAYDVARETISSSSSSASQVFDAALTLLADASAKKAKAEEVRSWASKAMKLSDGYGHRWQIDLASRIAEALASQKEFAAEAVQYARQAERMLGTADDPGVQRRVLSALSQALASAGKADEAKEVEAKLDKIPLFKYSKYAGRDGKADQVVAIELFTGAECPPCVAADVAFDYLAKTYPGKDVVLMQYHLHIPGPDPLTNADTEARSKYYEIRGTPSIFFNGKADAEGGGRIGAAKAKYDEYVAVIKPLLEKKAKADVKVSAQRKDAKIEITGTVDNLEKPGDDLRLRFVLVEERVKYQGGNKQDTHHYVVRDLPGGVKGLALKEKSSKHTATVDLAELRKKLTAYLEGYEKSEGFPNKERPLDLKKLKVVALVQNDATKEILQAAQVEIKDAE